MNEYNYTFQIKEIVVPHSLGILRVHFKIPQTNVDTEKIPCENEEIWRPHFSMFEKN